MFLTKKYLWVVSVLFLFLARCGETENETSGSENKEPDADYVYKVELLGQDDLQKLINQRRDRILLINVWATWCIPCREEFPDLVQLAENYKDRQVDIVAISADYPDEIETKIIPFLKSQQVNFPVYVQNFENQEDFINFLSREWSGALPASFIYNATGEQKLFLLGKQSYQEFADALQNEIEN
ncbi:MAG: redoxin domain-containing protein [bacterium]|nr:MAG: redoxin domain-containing protein [bacterium]